MISPAELAVLALAGYRGTQLVVHDSLLDPARTRVDTWQQQRPQSAIREAVVTLISCVYCAGWWLSGALLATWLLVTGRWDTRARPRPRCRVAGRRRWRRPPQPLGRLAEGRLMSDNVTAVLFVLVFSTAGAWSTWLKYRERRAEIEARRDTDGPGAAR